MDVAEAVQWWGDWQLRILVLASLFLQYFLFITAALRKRRIPPWLRFSIWLAYLGSDAVAIYALATLWSNQRKRKWVPKARDKAALEALWAPVLLLHLGGRDGITAYSIEDNELWKRHVLTAASQIAVAIYVFCKSGSGDIRLFQATILIFVPGILKCLEKPWALNRASIYSMANNSGFSEAFSKDFKTAHMKDDYSIDSYVKNAVQYFKTGSEDGPLPYVVESPYKLFVDLSYSYGVRLQNLIFMATREKKDLRNDLYKRLSDTFDRFYTKRDVYKNTFRGPMVRTVAVFLPFAAIGLFHKSHTEAYNKTDVNVTYILLCCTASLECISAWLKPYTECYLRMTGLPMPDQVAQYNLIWYLASRKKHSRLLRWLLSRVGCKGLLDRLRCMKSCEDSGITELVRYHVINGWKETITDVATYRDFNDNRGQLTLRNRGYLPKNDGGQAIPERNPLQKDCSEYVALGRSIRRPFDESVLLWHLATDFCFYKKASSTFEAATQSRKISNYMAYLLFVQPEMLITGARHGLFKAAYRELRYGFMRKENLPQGDDPAEELGRRIVRIMEEMGQRRIEGTHFVHEAWALAEELSSIARNKGEETMWEVIRGVWVEMLCFSAGRSRGFLHAKSLGKGGEYLSCVWLLLWYMGMETFAVRLQRTGLQEEGDMSAAVPKRPVEQKHQVGTEKTLETASSTDPLVPEDVTTISVDVP